VVILLVAIFLLFVVGAMAVLAIDVVSFYTARSEAQLAADGAALSGARVLANSGMTSNPSDTVLVSNAENLARTVATQVAVQNKVGGRILNAGEVNVSFSGSIVAGYDPQVTVQVTRNDLPTFFARIWGRTQVTVKAAATAEAYNPSGITASFGSGPPVAPVCVKPWLLPNMDPTGTNPNAPIFNASGGIVDANMLGKNWPNLPAGNPSGLIAACNGGDCSSGGGGLTNPQPGRYYPGAIGPTQNEFPVPTQSLPSCSAGLNDYQLAIVGCVERPIACGSTPTINIDTNPYTYHTTDRDGDTVEAGKCLIHDKGAIGESDSIDPTWISGEPFQFLAGTANPVANAVGKEVLLSDSLVTVPVFDSRIGAPPSTTVTVIGFLQLFLNHQGVVLPPPGPGVQIPATVINMAGCGATASGQPILGNGSSPVAVRLVAR
jgi:hypothetical protein